MRCFECDLEIFQWEEGDDAGTLHQRWSGRCRFLRGRPVGNVPIGVDISTIPTPPRRSRDVVGAVYYGFDFRPDAVADRHGATVEEGPSNIAVGASSSSAADDASSQLSNNTTAGVSSASMMQEAAGGAGEVNSAGESSASSSTPMLVDEVQPNNSAVTLSANLPLPPSAHTMENGMNSICCCEQDECPVLAMARTLAEKLQVFSGKIAEMQRQVNQRNEILLCKVCLERNVEIVFLPCGHLASCAICAHELEICPICRVDVRDPRRRNRIYFT